jgi:hypothetical protein
VAPATLSSGDGDMIRGHRPTQPSTSRHGLQSPENGERRRLAEKENGKRVLRSLSKWRSI